MINVTACKAEEEKGCATLFSSCGGSAFHSSSMNSSFSSTSKLDIRPFADPDFDAKKWINASLTTRRSNGGTKDATNTAVTFEQETTVLVTKLQIASEQVSSNVTQVIDSVVKTMPRLLYDLKLISDDAQATRRGIEQVRKHLETSQDDDTDTALEKLRQLHLVKTRMESCCSALREAEDWSNLEVEATRVLEREDYEAAATRLQSAQHSLEVFQHTPEFDRRKELLQRLREQLESALRPKVTDALKIHDAGECHKYYKVYGRIGRADEFVDLYFESRTPSILEKWKKSDKDEMWVEALDDFYKSAFAILSEEYVWCASIFPDPKPVVQALVQHIVQSLDPSLADRLASIATHGGNKALPALVSAFIATESFGASLDRLFSKPPVVTASADTPSLESLKRHSRRRSSSNQLMLVPLTLRHADANTWSYVLYVPFLPFQSQYASLERQCLRDQLDIAFKAAKTRSGMELVQYVDNKLVSKIFALTKESLDRCLKMTHGFGAVEWIRTLNGFIDQVKVQLQIVFKQVQNSTDSKNTIATTARQDKADAPRSSSDLDDLDFEEENTGDWTSFQVHVRLLSICQALEQQLTAFEDTIRRELEGVRSIVTENDQDENSLLSPLTPKLPYFNSSGGNEAAAKSSDIREHRRRLSINNKSDISRHERKRSMNFTAGEHLQTQQQNLYPRSSLALLRTSRLNSLELQRMISQISSITEEGQDNVVRSLLKDAHQSILELTQECQSLIYGAIFAPIVRHYENIVSMTNVWAAPEPAPRSKEDASIDIDMPQFSLSPSEYITRVGEQLLMLPQQFEMYADDTALAYNVETIPFVQKEDIEAASEEDQDGSDVVQLWTTVIARGAMNGFLKEIQRIKRLSAQGKRQLRTDISYLFNVLSALDVQPLPQLVKFNNDLTES